MLPTIKCMTETWNNDPHKFKLQMWPTQVNIFNDCSGSSRIIMKEIYLGYETRICDDKLHAKESNITETDKPM